MTMIAAGIVLVAIYKSASDAARKYVLFTVFSVYFTQTGRNAGEKLIRPFRRLRNLRRDRCR